LYDNYSGDKLILTPFVIVFAPTHKPTLLQTHTPKDISYFLITPN